MRSPLASPRFGASPGPLLLPFVGGGGFWESCRPERKKRWLLCDSVSVLRASEDALVEDCL